jgi:hypothetical protein
MHQKNNAIRRCVNNVMNVYNLPAHQPMPTNVFFLEIYSKKDLICIARMRYCIADNQRECTHICNDVALV